MDWNLKLHNLEYRNKKKVNYIIGEIMMQINHFCFFIVFFLSTLTEMKSQEQVDTSNYPQQIDLILFMGQSNIAGRGKITLSHPEDAPVVTDGAGFEFRAITDTINLYRIDKKLGVNENLYTGINDGSAKTGGCVPSFVNAYYKSTQIPVVVVSASEGGTNIGQWQPNTRRMKDAIERLERAKRFLNANNIKICHLFMVWCQGESDGDISRNAESYKKYFYIMFDNMKKNGVEKCFMIMIGEYNGNNSIKVNSYQTIQRAQEEINKENDDVIMVCSSLRTYKEYGMMRDEYHYYQDGYNRMGNEAGKQSALYREKTYPSVVSYEVITILKTGVITYCSENNLDFTGIDSIHSYYLQLKDDSLVRKATRFIPKNTGVLVEGNEGIYKVNICSDSTAIFDDLSGNVLIGTTVETDINELDYILGVENGVIGFRRVTEPTFINAHSAYLPKERTKTDCLFLPLAVLNNKTYDTYDVNRDGIVNISDIVAVINYISNGACDKCSDVNLDKTTDISDIVAIINYISSFKE